MRIVTGDAGQLPSAFEIALAQSHGEVMLQQVILWCGGAIKRHQKNAERISQILARPKITIAFSLFQHACIASLVARHADVVAQPGSKLCGIDDGGRRSHLSRSDGSFSWT